MIKSLALFAIVLAVALARPQFSGGSAGGLINKGEPLKHYVIGLSRGIEVEHHGHGGGEGGQGGGGDEGGFGGFESGGEGGAGGGGGDGGHHEEHHEHKEEGKGGFGGSDFKTPVDIHHEKEIHLKAHPEYHYDYHVADHKHKDYKSKHEVRDGYKVKGTYSLLEPDHKTIRVVDYVSDKKTGFIAKVSYKKHQ